MFAFIGNGGKAASRAGWGTRGRDTKSHGKKSLGQGLGPKNEDSPTISQQKWIFQSKKKNWGLEKKVLWTLVDANKLLLKGSSFTERLSWFFASPLRKLPEYWKKSENLGNSGSLAFPTHRGKFPRDLFPSSHTRHDPNSRSQLPARKGQFLNASDLFSPV